MNSVQDDYKNLIGELVKKQMMVLGPNIAVDLAKKVPGMSIDENGAVLSVFADPQLVWKNLVHEYSLLSGPIAQMLVKSLLDKYPKLAQ